MEYISRIENGEYELVVRCNKYEDYQSFQRLIRDEMARIDNKKVVTEQFINTYKSIHQETLKQTENKCGSCKCKGKETSKADNELNKSMEEKINLLKCELAARANETEKLKEKLLHLEGLLKEKDCIISGMKERQLAQNVESKNGFDMWMPIFAMCLLKSGSYDSYYKGKCNAYESIFMSDKQEENRQKAREYIARLKKSVENLTNGETK